MISQSRRYTKNSKENKLTNLGGAAYVDGDGSREDGVADAGAPEVADAELHAGDAAVARGHVRPHAGQRLRYQGRHAAVQHLERLPASHIDINTNTHRRAAPTTK